jgi:hypothetical protein
MSNTQEYYIRKATETDARGPFTLEQLTSLAENGQVDSETFYYDAAGENWASISANPALLEALFPAKKSLRVRPKSDSQVRTLNTLSETDRPITVGDMLLAAEGLTEETKDKADPAIARARAAGIGLYGALAILIVLTAAFTLPQIDLLFALDLPGLIAQPLAFLGLFNLLLAICLGLGATGAYPTVRFSAMLTLGFAGTVFFLLGQTLPLAYCAAASVGLFFCTILLNVPMVSIVAALGFAGACGLAHHFFTS